MSLRGSGKYTAGVEGMSGNEKYVNTLLTDTTINNSLILSNGTLTTFGIFFSRIFLLVTNLHAIGSTSTIQ